MTRTAAPARSACSNLTPLFPGQLSPSPGSPNVGSSDNIFTVPPAQKEGTKQPATTGALNVA